MATFGRLLTAMITPFDEEGNIDFPQARKLAKSLTQSGTDGLVIGVQLGSPRQCLMKKKFNYLPK